MQFFSSKCTLSKIVKRKQFDPERFDGKIIKCSCLANINPLNLVLCQKIESWGNLYYQTVKLRTL